MQGQNDTLPPGRGLQRLNAAFPDLQPSTTTMPAAQSGTATYSATYPSMCAAAAPTAPGATYPTMCAAAAPAAPGVGPSTVVYAAPTAMPGAQPSGGAYFAPTAAPGAAASSAAYYQQSGAAAGPPDFSPPEGQALSWGKAVEKPPIRTRVHIRAGSRFHGCLPRDGSTFAWPELAVTPESEFCSMAPVPGVEKTWYNTVFYYPEQRSHVERQFLERYVPGPDGEWLDVVKARRMVRYFEEKQEEEIRDRMERQMLVSGAGMRNTGYSDPYSGEPLVTCRGELASREAILEEHGVHRSAAELAKVMMQDARSQSDFDNLRLFWPFGTAHRNKMVSQHTYDWFDRNHNPYIPSDRSMEIYELNSMYVDREHFEKNLGSQILDQRLLHKARPANQGAMESVKYVQM